MQSIKVFLDTVAIYGQPKTVESYGFWLAKFHDFVRKPVEEVEAGDVARWIAVLRLKYAPTSVSLAIAIVKEYLIDYAPQIKARRIRHPRAHPLHPSDPITPEEYVSMLTFIHADTKQGVFSNMLIRLLYDSGGRIGEIKKMFDQRHRINIQKRFAIIDTEKTTNTRYITWGKDTAVFLETWLSFKKKFPTTRHCQRIVREIAAKSGITEYKKLTPHSFRRTKARRVLDQGGDIRDVASYLGHTNPASSLAYLNDTNNERLTRQQKWVDS